MLWFHKKKQHVIDELARQNSIASRKASAELKAKQAEIESLKKEADLIEWKARIADLKAKFEDDEEEEEQNPIEALLMQAILPKLLGTQTQSAPVGVIPPFPTTPNPTGAISPEVTFSEENIRDMLNKFPKKYLQIAKKLNPEQLSGIIKAKLPYLSANSITKAIQIIKE